MHEYLTLLLHSTYELHLNRSSPLQCLIGAGTKEGGTVGALTPTKFKALAVGALPQNSRHWGIAPTIIHSYNSGTAIPYLVPHTQIDTAAARWHSPGQLISLD